MKNNLSFISPTYKVFSFLLCTLFARLLSLDAAKPIEVDDEKEAYDDSTNNKAYNILEYLEQMDHQDEIVISIEIIKKGLQKNDVTEVSKGLKSLRIFQINLTKKQAQGIYKMLIGRYWKKLKTFKKLVKTWKSSSHLAKSNHEKNNKRKNKKSRLKKV